MRGQKNKKGPEQNKQPLVSGRVGGGGRTEPTNPSIIQAHTRIRHHPIAAASSAMYAFARDFVGSYKGGCARARYSSGLHGPLRPPPHHH
jgi:hypothetical protein